MRKFKPSEEVRRRIVFARFCIEQGLDPKDAAELAELADRAYQAGLRRTQNETNRIARIHELACDRFRLKAILLGYEVGWFGYVPRLMKDDVGVCLPIFDE